LALPFAAAGLRIWGSGGQCTSALPCRNSDGPRTFTGVDNFEIDRGARRKPELAVDAAAGFQQTTAVEKEFRAAGIAVASSVVEKFHLAGVHHATPPGGDGERAGREGAKCVITAAEGKPAIVALYDWKGATIARVYKGFRGVFEPRYCVAPIDIARWG
jgi:hypothetical protein